MGRDSEGNCDEREEVDMHGGDIKKALATGLTVGILNTIRV